MTTRDTTPTAGRNATRRRRRPLFGAYPRVSELGDRSEDELRSVDLQVDAMRASAAIEGVDLVVYPADLDVSGSKASRPSLDAIREAIADGELDGIYVDQLNRLSRLPARERVELVEWIKETSGTPAELGYGVMSAKEPNDLSTYVGRYIRENFYSLARMEWERYADQFDRAKQLAIANGKAILNAAPLGYDFDEDHRLVVDEDVAPLVVELFERRAADDADSSYGKLADWLAGELGRPVFPQSVKRWLENRVYLGELWHGGELSPKRHAAIVDDVALWDDVQRVGAKRTTGRGVAVGRAKELLAGIAKCQGCAGPLFKHHGNGKGAYVCQNRQCRAKGRALVAELDAYVTAKVIEWAGPNADELVDVQVELGARGDRILAEDRLAKARAAALRYEQDVDLELAVGEDAYAAGRQARQEAIARAEAELEACGIADEVEVVRSTLREALTGDELDVAERRRLFAIAIESVVVSRPARHGAPVAERALVWWRDGWTAAPAATDAIAEDSRELVAHPVG